MKAIATFIPDLFELHPTVFKDNRGYFFESFNEKKFQELTGSTVSFVQDNQSLSQKGVLRGLHFQVPPFAQAKLVRVLKGKVLDVAVDIRKGSPTFGKHFSVILDSEQHNMLFIPEGFAHGFHALEDDTVFFYKCSNYYHKDSERCIHWDDADLNIEWNAFNPLISDKDKEGISLAQFDSPFNYGK